MEKRRQPPDDRLVSVLTPNLQTVMIRPILKLAILLFMYLPTTGCTVIGIVASNSSHREVTDELASFDPESVVSVELRNGTRLKGQHVVFVDQDSARYATNLLRALDREPELRECAVPGQPVAVILPGRSEPVTAGRFVGYSGLGDPKIIVMNKAGERRRYPLSGLESVALPGASPCDAASLSRWVAFGVFPSLVHLEMVTDRGSVSLEMEEIRRITGWENRATQRRESCWAWRSTSPC